MVWYGMVWYGAWYAPGMSSHSAPSVWYQSKRADLFSRPIAGGPRCDISASRFLQRPRVALPFCGSCQPPWPPSASSSSLISLRLRPRRRPVACGPVEVTPSPVGAYLKWAMPCWAMLGASATGSPHLLSVRPCFSPSSCRIPLVPLLILLPS